MFPPLPSGRPCRSDNLPHTFDALNPKTFRFETPYRSGEAEFRPPVTTNTTGPAAGRKEIMKIKALSLIAPVAIVAGGLLLSSTASVSAAGLPGVSLPDFATDKQTEGIVKKVHRRRYRHYHGRRYRHRRHGFGHFYRGWWYPAPWWGPPVVVVPGPRRRGRHVRWCLRRYRSYDPATDEFFGFDGRYHRCRSPYRP